MSRLAIASTGLIEIRMEPPMQMDWPAPRPENVAAAALPLPATPEVPAALRAHGFDRVLRLFGDHGEVGFIFLRTDPDGLTAIGDEIAAVVELEGLDPRLDQLLVLEADDYPEAAFGRNPYREPEHPVSRFRFRVWDAQCRNLELASAGASFGDEVSAQEWQIGDRYRIVRVRRVQVHHPKGG